MDVIQICVKNVCVALGVPLLLNVFGLAVCVIKISVRCRSRNPNVEDY